MLALTIALGVWQIERLHWKLGLLAEIDRAEGLPPAALSGAPLPFEKVAVVGRLRDDLVAFYGSEVRSTLAGPQLGAQVLTPLERADGPPVMIDRGWMPEHAALPTEPGETTVVGYVRPAEHSGYFSPGDDPVTRRFWALDPQAIGAALGLKQVAPFTIVALGSADGPLQPATALPRPPNDHLGYAITWFGLGGCLVFVFAAFVRRTIHS